MENIKNVSNKFKIKKISGGSTEDIFFNQFDVTWFNVNGSTSHYPRVLTKLPIEQSIDDGTVTYSYNNDLFRSDDFKADHGEKRHILFAGCSQTEGVGSPLDTIWPKMIYEKLASNNDLSGFFNIARSGYGWQKIISTFMVYVEKYGFPEYLFVLMPNLGRFFEWDSSGESWVYVQRYPTGINATDDERDAREIPYSVFNEKPLTVSEHRRSFIDFIAQWKLFEQYCETNGVKLLWASWDYNENENYLLANQSKNYIPMAPNELFEYIAKNRPDGKMNKHDIKRRDGHDGVLIHEFWESKFFAEIGKRGWLNV